MTWWARLSPRERALLTATAGLILAIGAWHAARPGLAALTRARVDAEQAQQQLLAAQAAVSAAGNPADRQAKVAERRRSADAMLGGRTDLAPEILFLQQLARDNRAEVRSLRRLPEARADKFLRVPVELTLEGNFVEVDTVVRQLERLPRLVSIERLQLQAAAAGSGRVVASLTIAFYADPARREPAEPLPAVTPRIEPLPFPPRTTPQPLGRANPFVPSR